MSVCEDEEKYQLDNDTTKSDKKHDKIFKTLLQNKKETAKFLNYFLELNINPNDLELQIVLYIGNNKWTASTSFADCEVEYPELNFNSLDTKFKLIDINNFKINDLLKLKTMVTNTMILEKCKNNDEVIENLNKIIKNLDNKKTAIKELKQIISYLYSDMKNIKDIINLIEESEVNETMSTVAERLREEYKNERLIGISQGITQGITQGISQGITQIIKNMLNSGMSESDILYYTKIDKKQFEKIKKEFENETK